MGLRFLPTIPSFILAGQPLMEALLAGGSGEVWTRRDQTSDTAAHPSLPSTISYFLKTWLDKYSENFCQSMDLGNTKYHMTDLKLSVSC
jgi:hypothetical protein